MRLSALIESEPGIALASADLDPEIQGITADSRKAGPGFLFAALPGTRADGGSFIADAVTRGAVAVLSNVGATAAPAVARLETDNPRRALARLAARFFGRQPDTIAAVTGTNGKTSVAVFTRQLWKLLGHQAASLGTLGIEAPTYVRAGSLTTPDPVSLHQDLAELADAGVDHLAMEASSHGLDQFRLDGIRIAAAAFTNLTRDHLDYHGTMEAYFAAKRRLFAEVMVPGGAAVLNADVEQLGELSDVCRANGHRVITFGRRAEDLRLTGSTPLPHGQRLSVRVGGRARRVTLPLVGAFQAMNALAALGLVVGAGAEPHAVLELLARLDSVPGRLQLAARRANEAPIYVDYAHTPDALETVLTALRPHAKQKLIVVFGCGGDRDAGKRPMMGAIAARLADRVIVTDDNPRTEDAAAIRKQILAASPGAIEIPSRADAIAQAIAALDPGDLLVIAGKGHERGQIVGTTVHPFDDVTVARQAVAELEPRT